jgi:hypothetical protein
MRPPAAGLSLGDEALSAVAEELEQGRGYGPVPQGFITAFAMWFSLPGGALPGHGLHLDEWAEADHPHTKVAFAKLYNRNATRARSSAAVLREHPPGCPAGSSIIKLTCPRQSIFRTRRSTKSLVAASYARMD